MNSKITDMKDGDIAVITVHGGPSYVGKLLQRVGDNVFYLGGLPSGNFVYSRTSWGYGTRVRILTPGEYFTVC